MILVKILFDKIYWSAFTVKHELFEHVDYHFFFLCVELLFRLVLGNVWRKELSIELIPQMQDLDKPTLH